ncbi:MAG: glycosyltransferase [Actinomycetia bacterium]|nr:glycosyltransferase [Actinomycetes bacterium]
MRVDHMRILCLLTSAFPFGTGEEFIREELEHVEGFDQVIVCALGARQGDVQTIEVPQGVRVIAPLGSGVTPIAGMRLICLRGEVLREIAGIIWAGRFVGQRLRALASLMRRVWQASDAVGQLCSLVVAAQPDTVVLYSYWFYGEAYCALLAKDRVTRSSSASVHVVSRAHRFDLYEEHSAYGYLPFRSYLLNHVDAVFPCSSHGARYLQLRYPAFARKIRPAFLGVAGDSTWDLSVRREASGVCLPSVVGHQVACAWRPSGRPFHVVSCSSLTPVKRVSLLAEAIGRLTFQVQWTHLGSGPEEMAIRKIVSTFPDNATAILSGQVSNEDVRSFYRETAVDVFVNVSASEGIPVSIMEALASGVPVLATDAGGSMEAVRPSVDGYLLPVDASADVVAEAIAKIHSLDSEAYAALSEGARAAWASKFDANRNYAEFFEMLAALD